jgi:hypothetical protein
MWNGLPELAALSAHKDTRLKLDRGPKLPASYIIPFSEPKSEKTIKWKNKVLAPKKHQHHT